MQISDQEFMEMKLNGGIEKMKLNGGNKNEVFAKQCLQRCNNIYNSMANDFRNYAYKQMNKGRFEKINRSSTLDNEIDNYYKYKLGLSAESPNITDKPMELSKVLAETIFGGKIPDDLLNKLSKQCYEQGINIKPVLKQNNETKISMYEYL